MKRALALYAGGLVLLTVFASRLFGVTVSKREWIGVAVTAAGLAFLAATLDGSADSAHAEYGNATLAIYVGAATVVGLSLGLPEVAAEADDSEDSSERRLPYTASGRWAATR